MQSGSELPSSVPSPMLDSLDTTYGLVLLSAGFFAGMLGLYHFAQDSFNSTRQKAYILSTFSAGVMTASSLPFVWTYLFHGLEVAYTAAQEGWMAALAKVAIVWFATYLTGKPALYSSSVHLLTNSGRESNL